MPSDLVAALAGGAIGSVLTAAFGQAARARVAWSEVDLHDAEAAERNAQLMAWVDDRTLRLVQDMSDIADEHSARSMFQSSIHGAAQARAKASALHEFRDEEWRARMALAELRAAEGTWHHLWRIARRRPSPALTARDKIERFLDRWREPVTRHGIEPGVVPVDRTRRTDAEALADLPTLTLD